MKVGILALQGAVDPHFEKLEALGVEPVRVVRASHLEDVHALIIPGGESTTFLHLLQINELTDPLQEFTKRHPVWGICAGAILMASEVSRPAQRCLGCVDVSVERNGYGRQLESFIHSLEGTEYWDNDSIEGVFIRAPLIKNCGPSVRVLLKYNSNPVMVEDGKHLLSTFHPELSSSNAVHEYFLKKARRALN